MGIIEESRVNLKVIIIDELKNIFLFTFKGFFALLWNALQDFTLRILLVCAAVAIILEVATADESERSIAWIDGFAIFVAVCVCSSVQAGNDYQKERQFQRLNKVADDKKMVTKYYQSIFSHLQ